MELTKALALWTQDAEIDRILKAFRLNAYAVLDLLPGVPDSDIKLCYRRKSLLIHPDKTSNPLAPEAFDRLKKAQTSLLDEGARALLEEAIADARMLIMRERKWTVDSEELKGEEFLKRMWPERAKEVLMEEEVRRRKRARVMMQEEGREREKEEKEGEERRRKREFEKAFEDSREGRIESWRDFQKGGSRVKMAAVGAAQKGGVAPSAGGKKKKMKVLG